MIIYLRDTSTQWFLLFQNIRYNKNNCLFQLAAFKIYAIIKTVYCFNWFSNQWHEMGSGSLNIQLLILLLI